MLLEFPLGPILAIFGVQVALILPTKFPVNWSIGSRDEVQNRFSRRISDSKDFSLF